MAAIMVVYMDIADDSWIAPYFAEVPAILAEYGGVSIAGSRDVKTVEGDGRAPDRVAVSSFPSLDAIDRFMADERYQHYRDLREKGATSRIFAFENAVTTGQIA